MGILGKAFKLAKTAVRAATGKSLERLAIDEAVKAAEKKNAKEKAKARAKKDAARKARGGGS